MNVCAPGHLKQANGRRDLRWTRDGEAGFVKFHCAQHPRRDRIRLHAATCCDD
jgi:hypothetical protein